MTPFDRVVLSTDDNPKYFEFWPLTVAAWRKFFPHCHISIAYVTSKPDDDSDLLDLVHNDDRVQVAVYRPGNWGCTANHAKVARYICAARYPDDVCLIHDMDTVPLQSQYTIDLLSQRQPGKLLAVGAEVYENTPHRGKFPAGYMTAEGSVFSALMDRYSPFVTMFDAKETILAPQEVFSDESLVRAQIARNGIPVQHVSRAVAICSDWIDRSWWAVDVDKLNRGGYVECNMLRPWHEHTEEMLPIVQYILGDN